MSAPLTPDPLPEARVEMEDRLRATAVSAIVARFTDASMLEQLVLPSSMYKDADPTKDAISHYLANLLHKQPAVFIERYGQHLVAAELPHFNNLRTDYEIDYLLKDLEKTKLADSSVVRGRATASARNRRFAKMNRLLKEGEYFSDENMRDRAPLLYHQYVGQYLQGPQSNAHTMKEREKLSEGLMRQLGELEHRSRLDEAMKVEGEQNSEEEEEEDFEDEACVMDTDTHPGQDRTSTHAHDTSSSPPGTSTRISSSDPGVRPPAHPPTHVKSGHFTAAPAARSKQAGAGQQPGAQPGPSISIVEMREQHIQFVEEMKARFMSGQDQEYVDYATIDSDKQLDLDWLEEEARDAEERYFDAD